MKDGLRRIEKNTKKVTNSKAMAKQYNITKENAREMQKLSSAKQRENTAKRKAMRELLMDELTKPVTEGSKITKLEWLIAKAINNTKDDVNLQNLIQLQDLLGERQTNNIVNITASKSAEQCGKEILDEIGE